MKHIWQKMTGWLGDMAKHLPSWIKGPLGIHSPSTVFATIGAQTMQGYGIGLQQGYAAHVMPVFSTLTGQISRQFRPRTSPFGSAAASTSSDRAIDQLLAEIRGLRADINRTGGEQLKVSKGQLDRLAAIPPTVARAVRGGQAQLVQGLRGGSLRG